MLHFLLVYNGKDVTTYNTDCRKTYGDEYTVLYATAVMVWSRGSLMVSVGTGAVWFPVCVRAANKRQFYVVLLIKAQTICNYFHN